MFFEQDKENAIDTDSDTIFIFAYIIISIKINLYYNAIALGIAATQSVRQD